MSVFKVGSNKSSVNNFPSVRPTLDLDFANSKTLDPRITFTRASGGSYTGADGLIKYAGVNEARFDHDPVTGESLGLLVEEGRTNLITYSEEFNDASWIKGGASITTNNIVAPDGTLTADKLVENTANAQHSTYKNRTGSNETVTFSVFAKAGERTILAMQLSNFLTESVLVNFNLLLGTKSNIAGGSDYTNSSASIIPYPNGWYRCILTSTKGAAVNTVNNPSLALNNDFAGISVYTGDGTSGLYIWGAQLEQGSFPTSYIPTVASTRTRAADSAIITGRNFSDFYKQTDYSIVTSHIVAPTPNDIYPRIFNISTNTDIDRLNHYQIPINITGGVYRVGVSVIENNSISHVDINTSVSPKTVVKMATTLSNNNSYFYVNGILIGKNFVCEIDSVTRTTMGIGWAPNAGAWLNSTISRLTYYPYPLKDSNLKSLTR